MKKLLIFVWKMKGKNMCSKKWGASSKRSAHHKGSRVRKKFRINKEDKALWMDMMPEKWSKHAFFIHAKAADGTRLGGRAGQVQGFWIQRIKTR